jgi:F-type H+-transporting ATPase subunit b
MISFDFTFVLVFISFLVFMFLMKSLFFDPIARIKDQRENKLFDDQAQVDEASRALRFMTGDYEAQLKEARKKAQEQIAQMSQDAKQQAAKLLAETREQARQELDKSLQELSQWREDTYQQLAGNRQELKHIIMAKVAGATVNTH